MAFGLIHQTTTDTLKRHFLCAFLSLSLCAIVPDRVRAEDAVSPEPDAVIDTAAPTPSAPIGSWLSAADKSLYQQIFKVQEKGQWRKADGLIKQLTNKTLMGHVLYQRYMHPTKYRSKYKELSSWLAKYNDHPGAWTVYRLAVKRRGKARWPKRPMAVGYPAIKRTVESDPVSIARLSKPKKRSKEDRAAVRSTENLITREIKKGRPERAEKYFWAIARRGILTDVEHDQLMARVASSHYFSGDDEKAYALASTAAQRSRKNFAQADWISGLSAWRVGDCQKAISHFTHVAQSKNVGQWNESAGAYWAARSHIACGQPEKVTPLLMQAAKGSTTFYGQIAMRQLGIEPESQWDQPSLSMGDFEAMLVVPGVGRAVALSEIGETSKAEQEIRYVWGRHGEKMRKELTLLSIHLSLPASQLLLSRVGPLNDPAPLSASYPVPTWEPDGGFSIDRALLFAIMRKESNFRSNANSHAGAVGLMQVMPRTASFVMRDRSLRWNRKKLAEPGTNMKVSQRYMQHLMRSPLAGEDMFKFAVAYNGGPGNLQRWKRKMKTTDDPLLFIESIPAWETRLYIERVFSNLWMYRSRLGQSAPTLDAIAQGAWPTYESLDNETLLQAGTLNEATQHAQNR